MRFVCEVCLFVCLSILFLDFLPFYLILWVFYGLGSASVFEKDEFDRIERNDRNVQKPLGTLACIRQAAPKTTTSTTTQRTEEVY